MLLLRQAAQVPTVLTLGRHEKASALLTNTTGPSQIS